MKIRLITGSAYIAVLAGFFCLKIFVHDLFFDALIYFFALMGTFEMTRAMGDKLTKAGKIAAFVFASLCVPVCALFESVLFGGGRGVIAVAALLLAFCVVLLSLLVARHEETDIEKLGTAFLCLVYPNILLCVMVLCNHLPATGDLEKFAFNSDLAILFVFVISPVADSLAYVFGRFLKKYFPKKMAPVVSPNKTVIGGIGGLFGGVLGAAVLYFAYNAVCGSFENMGVMLSAYLIIGLVAAAATAWGDLVESCIKRKVGIKDMGKIMPGHGGVLDRIDGSQFTAIVTYIGFLIVAAIL
jgi:phosphatidate cytidylyltransferase